MRQLERPPDVLVGVHAEGVEVHAQRAREQHRVLRDDGDARAQLVQPDGGDVDAVDQDLAAHRFYYPVVCTHTHTVSFVILYVNIRNQFFELSFENI